MVQRSLILFVIFGLLACHNRKYSKETIRASVCHQAELEAEKDFNKGHYSQSIWGLLYIEDWNFENYYKKYLLDSFGIKSENKGCVIEDSAYCYSNRMDSLIHNKYG